MTIEGDRDDDQPPPPDVDELDVMAVSAPSEALWHEVLERLRTVQDNQAKLAGAVESLGSVVRDALGPDAVPPELMGIGEPPPATRDTQKSTPARVSSSSSARSPASSPASAPAAGPVAGPTSRSAAVSPPVPPSPDAGARPAEMADVRRISGRRLTAGTEPIMDALLGFKAAAPPADSDTTGPETSVPTSSSGAAEVSEPLFATEVPQPRLHAQPHGDVLPAPPVADLSPDALDAVLAAEFGTAAAHADAPAAPARLELLTTDTAPHIVTTGATPPAPVNGAAPAVDVVTASPASPVTTTTTLVPPPPPPAMAWAPSPAPIPAPPPMWEPPVDAATATEAPTAPVPEADRAPAPEQPFLAEALVTEPAPGTVAQPFADIPVPVGDLTAEAPVAEAPVAEAPVADGVDAAVFDEPAEMGTALFTQGPESAPGAIRGARRVRTAPPIDPEAVLDILLGARQDAMAPVDGAESGDSRSDTAGSAPDGPAAGLDVAAERTTTSEVPPPPPFFEPAPETPPIVTSLPPVFDTAPAAPVFDAAPVLDTAPTAPESTAEEATWFADAVPPPPPPVFAAGAAPGFAPGADAPMPPAPAFLEAPMPEQLRMPPAPPAYDGVAPSPDPAPAPVFVETEAPLTPFVHSAAEAITESRAMGMSSVASMATEILSVAPEAQADEPEPEVNEAEVISKDLTLIARGRRKRFRLR